MCTGRMCFPDHWYVAEAPVRLVIKKGSMVNYCGIINRNLEKVWLNYEAFQNWHVFTMYYGRSICTR